MNLSKVYDRIHQVHFQVWYTTGPTHIYLFLLNLHRIPLKCICPHQRYRFQDAGSLLRMILIALIHNVSFPTILCVISYNSSNSVSKVKNNLT